MIQRKTAKTRALSAELFMPIRNRTTHRCPYCDSPYKIGWVTKLLASADHYITCRSCGTSFHIPLSRDFDPSAPRQVRIGKDRLANCPVCRTLFVLSHRYEQCPCCGLLVRAEEMEPETLLHDNAKRVLDMLSEHRSGA